MQEKEKQPEFTLEDILREFGSGESEPETPDEEVPAAEPPETPAGEEPGDQLGAVVHGRFRLSRGVGLLPELIPIRDEDRVPLEEELPPEAPAAGNTEDEDVQIFTPQTPAAGAETIRLDTDQIRQAVRQADRACTDGETVRIDTDAVSAMTGETVRIDTAAVASAAASAAMDGETVRLDTEAVAALAGRKADAMDGATVAFPPVTDDPAAQAAPDIPEGAEPFSENWEPHYEEPMGEYIPPEPIVFRPRSRLAELKKKLIAGPERRYYALVEEGVGKLQIAIFISFLIVILSTVSIVLNQVHLVQPERMRLLVFGELFAMLFSAVLASDLLFKGFTAMLRGRFTLNSLLSMSFLVCMADGFFCLRGVRVPYCAAFCLEVAAALWAEYQRRSTEMGQMDTLRKASRLNRIAKAPDCYEGRGGFFLEDGEVEDFMDTYNAPSRPGKALNLYAFLAFLASAAIGVLGFVSKHDVAYGVQMWSAAILAAAPATIFLCHTRPAAILERRLHRFGVVLCGWQGAKNACGNAVVPLSDTDLFPAGSVKVNGVKFFSNRNTDQVIAYATALIEHSGTGLAPLFDQMLDSRYGQHHEVENFRIYESGGFGGDVCGDSVLVGSLEFLKGMGVHLPDRATVSQGVYTAVNGELCCVFAMAYGKLKGVTAGLSTLCAQRKVSPLLVTNNFLLSESFIREKFGVSTKKIIFPTSEQRMGLSGWTPDRDTVRICGLSTQESLAATGFAITGARALASSMRMGTIMHLFGGIVGLLIVLVLQFVDGGSLLTPANLLLFELIWAIPGMLLTEWTRGL